MRLLSEVDGDEVSLVNRAANRRKFLLLKGDSMDNDLGEILEVPFEKEGALLDELRKDGISDETIEKAFVAGIRLLKGIEDELSPELIEKLGTELYGVSNPTLNSSSVDSPGDLFSGGEDGADRDGDEDGPDKDGSGSGADLEGSGSAPKVAADDDNDADDMEKRDFSASERRDAASSGKALPDGSFPIKDKGDLKNAIGLAGKAKDPGKARAFIIRRAKALGATSMLPDSWNVSKEDDVDVSKEETSEMDGSVTETERGTVETHAVPVQKEDGSWDLTGVPEESRPFYESMIQKADQTASELEKAKEQLAKADDTLLSREMLEKAARLNHVAAADDLAPILKEASQKLDPETFEALEKMLAAADARVAKGDLFTEYGRAGFGPQEQEGDAYAKLVAKADEIVEKGTDISKEAAFDQALRANPELYNQYMFEQGMGVS